MTSLPTTVAPALADGTPEQRIQAAATTTGRGDHWREPRPRAGQVVTTQVALAVVVAASGRGPVALSAAAVLAAALLLLAWGRIRQRWLYEWSGIGLGYLTRRRALTTPGGPAALLDLVAPDTVRHPADLAGSSAVLFDDPGGVVALLEIGDRADLLGDGGRHLPSPAALLPADSDQAPPVRIQLVLSASAAPAIRAGGGLSATSYRQLTHGRLAGWERGVLAVRVIRAEGWSEEALRRTLAGTVRRIIRRFGPLSIRPLGEPAALRVFAELAHHDGRPVRESWQAVRCGGLLQTTFRLRRWPTAEGGGQLVPRLLTLPATAVTVSLHAEPGPTEGLTVRISAATPAELSAAARALRGLVTTAGGMVRRLDGAHLCGFTDTLPLAPPVPATLGDGSELELPYGSAGLVVGANRHGDPVTVRLFRPESTRVMIVGGVRAAQLLTMRAMALGCRVVVQTTRPQAWQPFVRGVGTPGETIPLVPPGRPVETEPGTPLSPLLVILDAPPPTGGPRPGAAWQTTLLVRDELTPADADALGRSDLALLQPLSPAEAPIAGAALGLGEAADWLTRIRPDMVAVVNRRALRWVLLAGTPLEAQLIGRPSRT
ncbi:type VII secretion protein EccE [Micromonospora sp. NBC_01739]|uniref:type VII secretion protein EccE n=1 Tax=Micromonospora sp. NBC_01739 TaxID=2975985 RepID=UPI002E118DF2|nr:type VII secretion protein EccE [Micromonospora sp. NBC_01739]